MMNINRQRFREFVKFVVSHFLVYSGFAQLYYHLQIKNKTDRCRILVYHRIRKYDIPPGSSACSMTVSADDFSKQIKFIKKYFHVLSLQQISDIINGKKSFPARSLAITFDDGYQDNYTVAFPILTAYSVAATIFVTTGYINTDNRFWWDVIEMLVENNAPEMFDKFFNGKLLFKPGISKNEVYRQLINYLNSINAAERAKVINDLQICCGDAAKLRYQNLSWNEILEMDKHDIAFGSHTVSHAIVTEVSEEQLIHEIDESKQVLKNKLKKRVFSFAYPRGAAADFNDEVIKTLKDSGYTCAVTNIKGINHTNGDLFRLKRIGIYGHESYATFICRCFNLL